MLWTDGSMYEGEWVKGIQHGLGRMVFPDGTSKEGYFENNVFKYPIGGGENIGLGSTSSLKGNNQMRSTNASSGFANAGLDQHPYHNKMSLSPLKQSKSGRLMGGRMRMQKSPGKTQKLGQNSFIVVE